MSLVEVENTAALQSFTLGGSGAMAPQEILGLLRHILVHSEVSLTPRPYGKRNTRPGYKANSERHTEKHTELTQSTTARITFSIVHGARILKAIRARLVVWLANSNTAMGKHRQ